MGMPPHMPSTWGTDGVYALTGSCKNKIKPAGKEINKSLPNASFSFSFRHPPEGVIDAEIYMLTACLLGTAYLLLGETLAQDRSK